MTDHVRWNGLNGRTYDFGIFPLGTEFKPASGVYVMCRVEGSQCVALYVGEAQSLYDRLNAGAKAHEGLKCARLRGATHISALLVDPANRLRVETELRHSLKPPCNKQSIPLNALGVSLFDIRR